MQVAHSYEQGQNLMQNRDYNTKSVFFQTVLEIGRRYKILNPERMRDSYGKLMYFLQDSCKPEVREIKAKEAAIKHLSKTYCSVARRRRHQLGGFRGYSLGLLRSSYADSDSEDNDMKNNEELTEDEVEQCIYSLGDHSTYIRFNREPCDRLITLLREYFDPRNPGSCSLAIEEGKEGSRLSHDHERQYTFVLQSMTLWREVLDNMFQLWHLAEEDLLDEEHAYVLTDTGQGLQRVQKSPRSVVAMQKILAKVQRKVGGWIGSSTVHLEDHNVPNALMFIDKYIQVPRFLGPLVLTLDKIPTLSESSTGMKEFIQSFGGVKELQKTILADFFRHAFDGSGADNFFDAGSCIDGRLTSAWNWCAKLEKKPFYPIFKLAGFSGVDGGDFRS